MEAVLRSAVDPERTFVQYCRMNEIDVLVVGAGPTGLALAIELQRLGLSYRLMEKSPEPARNSQALVVQARTLEQFERYGIAETAVARGRKLHGAHIFSDRREIVHIALDRIPGRYPYVLFLPQNETERLMIEHLHALGGQVERGWELQTFSDHGEGVEAQLAGSGAPQTVRARWIVGCDGAHSTVRRLTDVPFVGDTVGLSFFLGDLELTGPDVPGEELSVYLHRGDVVFVGRLDEQVHRVIVALHGEQGHDLRDPLLADFSAALARNAGPGITAVTARWMTPFRINQRKASSYRVGQAFLAGDASHIHSPVAGQGMNTGIQDAANLAWKLAAVRVGAPDALLDSYDAERGAVGEALLATTSFGLSAATSANPLVERIRDVVASFASKLDPVAQRLAGFVSETAIAYRDSPIVRDAGGAGTLRAGDRAPNADLRDGTWLLAPLQRGRALAIVVDGEGSAPELPADTTVLALTAGQLDAQALAAYGRGTLHIVRPDGYVGYRGPAADHAALAAYLATTAPAAKTGTTA
jgi:2-polyprenyl-6-methoxyphenol hydroxylase-like FAD-dependent oxidoreductase